MFNADNVYSGIKENYLNSEAIQMSDEKKELESEIMDEFEWALQDPKSEKIRQLGEVVSINTTKLTEAISELQGTVASLQSEVNGLNSQISSLKASGVAASPGAAASPAAGAAGGEPIATMAPKPASAPAAGGGMSMMGELKQLLAARRRKADGAE